MNETQKKSRPKTPRPVESFGPELLAALLKGATEGLEFTTSYATAVRFRLRTHQLRESMRKSGHEQYNLIARVRVSVRWPDETPVSKLGRHNVPNDRNTQVIVSLSPNDSEFGDMLRGAGVEMGMDQVLPATTVTRPLQDLEDLLADLKP